MLEETASHLNLSRTFLARAYGELEEGDLHQASEKGWGAAAQAVKAAAVERNWDHSRHRHLYSAMARLVEETKNPELGRQFALANELHANFYEGWLEIVTIRDYLDQVEKFVQEVGLHLEKSS